ncbi:MAG: SDR family NAD(P)-dependent oxidoreductase [bacterium]|nr:3-oxoacyl-ACP reductase [Deltaproteobacteria bacterium]MCP4908543.1 SDR family NAD(P)-dependent oxidoreductase [bacterium]
MKQIKGRVAVVTGAASGIGRGMAEAFAAAGMKVVLSDVREEALMETVAAVAKLGEVRGIAADVSRAEDVQNLADRTLEAFGAVHVLCNNAGVASSKSLLWESSLEEWRWHLDVMVMGVVHGIRSFVPVMLAQCDEGHVVNTASMGGLITGSDSQAIYMTAKHGVVALSEALQDQLAQQGERVRSSVLCPGFVASEVFDNFETLKPDAVRSPTRTKEGQQIVDLEKKLLAAGKTAREAGEIVLQAIRDERFYVLTHPDWAYMVEGRMRAIVDGADPARPIPPIGEVFG